MKPFEPGAETTGVDLWKHGVASEPLFAAAPSPVRAFLSVPVALILALLPSCSQAKTDLSALTPRAEALVNEAADLLLGSSKVVPPLVDFRASKGGAGYMSPSCLNNMRNSDDSIEELRRGESLRTALNLDFSWLKYADIFCDATTPLDRNIFYEHPDPDRQFLRVAYDLSDNLATPPVFRRPAERYAQGFFAKSGQHCQLWVRRNNIGQINVAAIRILASGPDRYSVRDRRQQECFIRGSLTALGLRGGSDLPFEKLAYRSPFPVGLSQAVLPGSMMRRHTVDVAGLVFLALPEQDFQAFTRGPIHRDEFVSALAKSPDIEKIARDMAAFEAFEQKERDAKVAPVIPSEPPKSGSPH
ncbi:MAG: hypothetical protein JHD35_12435 [Sphingopyxis sp.]|nr:hypothetical protein [Sphingopyxis sp.]